MANVLVVVDPDAERRSRFLGTAGRLLPPVEGLVAGSLSRGDLHALWAASPSAPIGDHSDGDGAGIVWGDAIDREFPRRWAAREFLADWRREGSFPRLDGFYAALAFDAEQGLAMGADLLGQFPVYYFDGGDVLLAGTSPELFRHHPSFAPGLDPAGLVGILLSNGLVDGRTLWRGVRRLGAGRLLTWKPGGPVREAAHHEPADLLGRDRPARSLPECLELLEETLDGLLARHAPTGERYGLLLSGGLDSRTLAGFLRRRGADVAALTLGLPGDLEMACARRVALSLAIEHRAAALPLERYPEFAERIAGWEHLANGCNHMTGFGWGIHREQRALAPRTVCGASLDLVLAGRGILDPVGRAPSFEGYARGRIHGWAFSPARLRGLLRREVFGNALEEAEARLRATYDGTSPDPYHRALCFDLYHRQRFHVGSCAGWQLSFGAWPVLPILDWRLLKTGASLPPDLLAGRRLQTALLRTRFPELARLPVDRNAFSTLPLAAEHQPWLRLADWVARKGRRLQSMAGRERRHYYRILDVDNAGWRAIRRKAEPFRSRLWDLFHRDALDALLPPPERKVPVRRDAIPETSGTKLLLGLALWAGKNL